MTLKPKVTYNKTVGLPGPLYQRWIIYKALHNTTFNGLVIRFLETELPPLDNTERVE
jgi:hypothetical protein